MQEELARKDAKKEAKLEAEQLARKKLAFKVLRSQQTDRTTIRRKAARMPIVRTPARLPRGTGMARRVIRSGAERAARSRSATSRYRDTGARPVPGAKPANKRTATRRRTDPAWERREAARLTREAARRFSNEIKRRKARRRLASRRARDVLDGTSRTYIPAVPAPGSSRRVLDDLQYSDIVRADRRDREVWNDSFADAEDRDRVPYARQDFAANGNRLAGDTDLIDGGARLREPVERIPRLREPARAAWSYDDPRPPMHVGRVAVLLVMKPGRRGIRRFNKTADPVLCTSGGCYISGGATYPAALVPRRRALGARNTLGRRAGACNHRLGCIFRNVRLGAGQTLLQPVDLRMIWHDRRARQLISTPSRCDVTAGRLSCMNGFYASDYDMWIVPEELAARAGARILEDAVATGLRRTPAQAGFTEAGYRFQ